MNEYIQYHAESSAAKDIDPANDCLKYICNRFELNTEQRYWLAFLYGCCYCGPTVYYIYNEFPDFENVNEGRLSRWWEENKKNTVFQTDRLRVKTGNKFVDIFRSYKRIINGLTQEEHFSSLRQPSPQMTYDNAFRHLLGIYCFGRFSLFIYLEMVHVLTGYEIQPTTLDLANANSCRNGLAYSLGRYDLDTHSNGKRLSKSQNKYLQSELLKVKKQISTMEIDHKNLWNIETTLCAFKKHKLGKRHVGYYIERQRLEIQKMERNVPTGVNWDVLWQFRQENYSKQWISEH